MELKGGLEYGLSLKKHTECIEERSRSVESNVDFQIGLSSIKHTESNDNNSKSVETSDRSEFGSFRILNTDCFNLENQFKKQTSFETRQETEVKQTTGNGQHIDVQVATPIANFGNNIYAPELVIYKRHKRVLAFGKRYHLSVIYKEAEPTLSQVAKIVEELETLGFICFYKCRDFIPGQRYPKTMVQCLQQSMKILIALSKAFTESDKCQYELDLALEECFSRGDDGDTSVIVPCRLEPCEVPRTLKPFHVLDIYKDSNASCSQIFDTLEYDSNYIIQKQSMGEGKSTDLESTGETFLQKLRTATMDEVVYFLAKPVAYDLLHFLTQCNDFRFFYSAMSTLGIEIQDSTVMITMKTLKEFVSRPYFIAQIFKDYTKRQKNKISKIGLSVYDMDDLMIRRNVDEVQQFNEIVRIALNADDAYDHMENGFVYSVEGVPKSAAVTKECRMLIHDALVQSPVAKPVYPQFDRYESRLETFRNYPNSAKPTKEELANAGYFCAEDGVVFRCFYCNGASWDFKPGDEPWARHAKYYHNCPFVLNSKGQDFINKCRFDIKREHVYSSEFKGFRARINSFVGWNKENAPSPTSLAEAGFYFTHVEDKVVCHMCGHGLRNWQRADSPWARHAMWSPNCRFVKKHMSAESIDRARQEVEKFELKDKNCIFIYSLKKREVQSKPQNI